MALKIRLRQQGRANRRSFRLVIADSRVPRGGKYIENLGLYDPECKSDSDVKIDHERLHFWIARGAQLTIKAKTLVARAAPEIYRNLVNREMEKKKKDLDKKKARKAKAKAKA